MKTDNYNYTELNKLSDPLIYRLILELDDYHKILDGSKENDSGLSINFIYDQTIKIEKKYFGVSLYKTKIQLNK